MPDVARAARWAGLVALPLSCRVRPLSFLGPPAWSLRSPRLHVGALLTLLTVSGCNVRVQAGASTAVSAPIARSASAPAERPEGFDEVRGAAPSERVDVDPQAAFALRRSGPAPSRALADSSTPGGLTAIALLDTTRAEARGFWPEGGVREVALEEGQRASTGFDLAAGECLTVIAYGGLGVREVDAFVVVGAAPDGDILAQDGSRGPIAIVGGQAGCARTLKAQHVEVAVLVRKGKGSVVAVVYRGRAGDRGPP